jgi:GNAT superfamily N-acetyltransferase
MNQIAIEFRQIDPDRHADVCVRFRADSYVCGEGTAERFYAGAGPGCRDYLGRLAERNRDLPGSCVHAWMGEQVVGQVEVTRDLSDPAAGKVNLLYLAPEWRGRGLGRHLEAYALDRLRGAGFTRAWLRVSRTNDRAVRFYLKHGWRDAVPDGANRNMRVMEKRIT